MAIYCSECGTENPDGKLFCIKCGSLLTLQSSSQKVLTFYELLQVDRRASLEVIEAAYHRLARMYHPDVNKSPDATEMMQRLNYAYSILSDAQKRAKYDSWLIGGEQQPQPIKPEDSEKDERATQPQPIVCESCGKIDETIRATVFQYVVSIIIMSFKRGGGGILCSDCRRQKAGLYILLSIIFGPWGFPWGLLWTLEAVITNISGGKQPADINAPLLRSMGAYFASKNDLARTIATLEASLIFEENAEVRKLVAELQAKSGSKTQSQQRDVSRPAIADRWVVIGVIIFVIILGIVDRFLLQKPVTTGLQPSPIPVYPTETIQARLRPGRLWVCSDLAHIRTEPSESSGVVATLFKTEGWYFDISETNRTIGNWLAVSVENASGWISVSDLCAVSQTFPATPTRQIIYYAPTPIPPTRVPVITNYSDVTLLQSGEFSYPEDSRVIAAVFDKGSVVTLAILGTASYAPNQTKVRVKVKVPPQDLQNNYIRPQSKVRSLSQNNQRGEPQVIGTILKEFPAIEVSMMDGFAIVTIEGWIINSAIGR